MSNRKPFNDRAGYVASHKNALTGSSNVIYIASEAGIDCQPKYVTVCEAHGTMIASANIPQARIDMKDASQWCEACGALALPSNYDPKGNEECGICGHALNAHSAFIAKGYLEAGDCRDPDIPLPIVIIEGDSLKAFNEASGITHNDAQGLGFSPYIVEIDAATAEVTIYGANELVSLSPQDACYLLRFLERHGDALREASLKECGVVYPHEEF